MLETVHLRSKGYLNVNDWIICGTQLKGNEDGKNEWQDYRLVGMMAESGEFAEVVKKRYFKQIVILKR